MREGRLQPREALCGGRVRQHCRRPQREREDARADADRVPEDAEEQASDDAQRHHAREAEGNLHQVPEGRLQGDRDPRRPADPARAPAVPGFPPGEGQEPQVEADHRRHGVQPVHRVREEP